MALLVRTRNLVAFGALFRAMPFDAAAHHNLQAHLHAVNAQVAAIPIRWNGAQREVLLVTTRSRRHWTVPKGWPLTPSAPHDCAAREAFEEGGVRGRVERYSLGDYEYWKKSKQGRLFLRVTAFAFHVDQILTDWPERGERKRAWFSPEVAATLIRNNALSALIQCAFDVEFAPERGLASCRGA